MRSTPLEKVLSLYYACCCCASQASLGGWRLELNPKKLVGFSFTVMVVEYLTSRFGPRGLNRSKVFDVQSLSQGNERLFTMRFQVPNGARVGLPELDIMPWSPLDVWSMHASWGAPLGRE